MMKYLEKSLPQNYRSFFHWKFKACWKIKWTKKNPPPFFQVWIPILREELTELELMLFFVDAFLKFLL